MCGGIRVVSYSTCSATVPVGTIHAYGCAAARVGGAQGALTVGLCPRPTREEGFPSNLLLALIDTSPLLI
jgi:hypothetical protein